jgi:hypothetical protein
LREWYLNYQNHTGKPDRMQIEINFLMRACALAPKVLAAAALAGVPPCQFLILETEELFGGKIKAMVDRRHPRDLYDLFRFTKTNLKHNPPQTRGALRKHHGPRLPHVCDGPLRYHRSERARTTSLSANQGRRPADRSRNAEGRLAASRYLDHKREAAYLEAMAAGHYRPELLFPDEAAIVGRIRQHPALLWKADNVARHLSRAKNF